MDQIELDVTKREILGKKVRFLRRQGVTPAHLFGHGVESTALQCETDKLKRLLVKAGKTRLVTLKLATEKEPKIAVVREVQKDAITRTLLHVDFYEIKMTEEIKLDVPIVLVGEAPAAKLKDARLVQELNTLTVECLPADIPNTVEIDVSSLTETDQAIRVKDIKLAECVNILNDADVVVARIGIQVIEVEKPKVVEEVAEAAEAAEEAPAEGTQDKEKKE